jgi:hypothetical protein
MAKYLLRTQSLMTQLGHVRIVKIPREENSAADALSKLASSNLGASPSVKILVEEAFTPAIDEPEMILSVQPSNDSWMDPIIRYLKDGNLPPDSGEASKRQHRSARFCLINDRLYKRGFSTPFLKCLTPEEGAHVIREIHEGPAGAHQGARISYQKILRLGYFWPTLQKDTLSYVKKCDACQRHSNVIHAPATTLTSVSGPWPFAQWGLDIVGPLPTAPGQRKYLIVAIDYFTKWMEAEPLASITEKACWNFLWRNIICRFGVPRTISSDNGLQFTGKQFAEECAALGIEHRFSSVYFPQANGQVEVSNRTLLDGLKKRLETTAGNWPNIPYRSMVVSHHP